MLSKIRLNDRLILDDGPAHHLGICKEERLGGN